MEAAAAASAAQVRQSAWQAQVTGKRSEKRAQGEIQKGDSTRGMVAREMRASLMRQQEQIAGLLGKARQVQGRQSQQSAAVAAAQGVEFEQGRSRLELEQAGMAGEDARSLCVEQQGFIKVCTVAQIRQHQQGVKIQEWVRQIQRWKRERKEDKEEIKRLKITVKDAERQEQRQQQNQAKVAEQPW